MTDFIKDEGCWIIQYVSSFEPWKGTKQVPFKEHRFYPLLVNDFTTFRCSTCGMVKKNGVVLSVIDPVLESEREPTETELAAKAAREAAQEAKS